MQFITRNGKELRLRRFTSADQERLCAYLDGLGSVTKKRFGPHAFEHNAIAEFYTDLTNQGYLAIDRATTEIIAYAIIRLGYLQHDCVRLQAYGLTLDQKTDCTFAPSVADAWQSAGIGQALLQYILSDLQQSQKQRLILWGGVQSDNHKAVNFYLKNGFKILGCFQYNGDNYDMMLSL
jgi:GNAT superfamily N-acetyltransferase